MLQNYPKLNLLSYSDPKQIFSEEKSSILPLLKAFPNIADKSDWEDINTEWKLLRVSNIEIDQDDVVKFWLRIKSIKNGLNETMFKKLSDFILDILCLPHSSAAAERQFADLNLIKTKKSNSFKIETISAIMTAKELLLPKHKSNVSVWTPEFV